MIAAAEIVLGKCWRRAAASSARAQGGPRIGTIGIADPAAKDSGWRSQRNA
jgi:hypothetical protein